jgi:hypothetical protein
VLVLPPNPPNPPAVGAAAAPKPPKPPSPDEAVRPAGLGIAIVPNPPICGAAGVAAAAGVCVVGVAVVLVRVIGAMQGWAGKR